MMPIINSFIVISIDILTPLPALGVDFTIIPGKGPKIINPLKTAEDVAALKPMHDVAKQVPFLGPILQVSLKISMQMHIII
jgi:uroporphyrinogen decarboxylase